MSITLELQPVNLADYFETINRGAVSIKGHRIGIEQVIERYRAGYSPQQVAQDFPGLSLETIYATITYYLHHQQELDTYLTALAATAHHEDRSLPQSDARMRQRRAYHQMLAIAAELQERGVKVDDLVQASREELEARGWS